VEILNRIQFHIHANILIILGLKDENAFKFQ
jgi:hypothetical protein